MYSLFCVFLFKQKTAYEMRISDWSSDVCSSDLNAVIGNGSDDRATNPALRWAAPVLAVAVLPLAGIAYYSMHLRVIQYGWTPERIWGVIAALNAPAYGIAGLWAVVKGRRDFEHMPRPLQQELATGLARLRLLP